MIISPSYSSRKIYLFTKTYCRTPAMLGHCQDSVSSEFSQVAAVVFFRNGRRSRQYPRVALLLVLAHLFLHRTSAWHLAGVGDEQQKVRRPVTDAGGGFADASRRHGADDATQRRPNHRLASCGRRRRAAEGAPPRDRRRRRLCGRQQETRRRRRHPAPPKPPELAAWPSTPPNALPLSS